MWYCDDSKGTHGIYIEGYEDEDRGVLHIDVALNLLVDEVQVG